MTSEQFRLQLNITRFVYTMDVAKCRRNREVRGDGRKCGVDVVDVFGLGVQRAVVDISVVNTVFLTTSNTDFLYISLVNHQRRELGEGHTISSHCFMGAAL